MWKRNKDTGGSKKRKTRTERQKLKDKCWELCSLYNRMKDADWRGYVACVTCGVVKHYKQQQGGHFIPGRTNGILFEDQGIHAQCYSCNMMKGGNPRKYDAYMKKRYGQRVINKLDKLSESTVQLSEDDLRKKIEEYKIKIESLGSFCEQ